MNESCYTNERAMPRVWISLLTNVNASRKAHARVVSFSVHDGCCSVLQRVAVRCVGKRRDKDMVFGGRDVSINCQAFFMYVDIYVCIYIYMYVYICTYIYMYVQQFEASMKSWV